MTESFIIYKHKRKKEEVLSVDPLWDLDIKKIQKNNRKNDDIAFVIAPPSKWSDEKYKLLYNAVKNIADEELEKNMPKLDYKKLSPVSIDIEDIWRILLSPIGGEHVEIIFEQNMTWENRELKVSYLSKHDLMFESGFCVVLKNGVVEELLHLFVACKNMEDEHEDNGKTK